MPLDEVVEKENHWLDQLYHKVPTKHLTMMIIIKVIERAFTFRSNMIPNFFSILSITIPLQLA
jgi:hypothetical protein